MHRLFREEGATNVRWVWAVNTFTGLGGEDRSVARYYPGDDFVDWVSVTGFNWGTSNAWSEWQDVDAVLGKTYRTLARFGKPVMVSELGTVGTGGNSSAWVGATMRRLRAEYPLVKAVVWFDARYPGGIDFRLGSREGAALAAVTSTPYWEPELRLVTPSPEARAPARGGT
jgi:beta-mannanase